ncbi:winged helix-turn-helix domain-containing protein [Bacillus wiedmannii]|uniref:winged helix-turn-helix domain-containing protein n=1 Tax=Bacillus wiedmannii TaxID=1890302 RepID=UPI00352AF5B7
MQYGQEAFWNTRNIQYVIKEKFTICMSREGSRKMLHRIQCSASKQILLRRYKMGSGN